MHGPALAGDGRTSHLPTVSVLDSSPLSHISPSCLEAMKRPMAKRSDTRLRHMASQSNQCIFCGDGEGSTTPVTGWFKNQVLTEAACNGLTLGFPSPARASHRQESFNPPQHRRCRSPSRTGRSHLRSWQRARSSALFPQHSLASGCLHSQPQRESEILVQFFPAVNTVQRHSDFCARFLSEDKGAQKLDVTSGV